MLKKTLLIVKICLIFTAVGLGQGESTKEQTNKRKNRYVFLPATAYSPETGLTAGALSAIIFDLAKGDTLTRMSQIAILGIVSTKGQLSTGVDFTFFTPQEKYRFEGRISYKKDVDRNFGVGNNANGLVHELNPETGEIINSYNFMEIRTSRIEMRVGGFRKLRPSLFAGLLVDYRRVWNYEPFANRMISPTSAAIESVPINSSVLGFGLGLTYDTRDNINNAHTGKFIQMRHLFYGGTYQHYSLYFDARFYTKITKKQSLALRFITDQRYHTKSFLPLYSLPPIGGKEFARGYFEGTYRDNHLLGVEAEYRMPFNQDPTSKFWQFWKRLSIHAFVSSAQVASTWEDVGLTEFRTTIGIGGRYVLNFPERINLRLDIGYGLHDGAVLNGKSLGFYFFIGEAF